MEWHAVLMVDTKMVMLMVDRKGKRSLAKGAALSSASAEGRGDSEKDRQAGAEPEKSPHSWWGVGSPQQPAQLSCLHSV